MDQNYKILVETEEIWAKMLMEVLDEYKIPYAAKSVYGAGLVIRAGLQDRLTVFVPAEYFDSAAALAEELFSESEEDPEAKEASAAEDETGDA